MKLPSSHGTPATLTDFFPEQPANHASSHGRRARAVRSLFFGKERAPSESVLGVRAVPLSTENPRRTLLGDRTSGIRASRKSSFVLCSTIHTTRSTGYTGLSYKRQDASTHLNSHNGRSAPPKAGKASCVTLLVVFPS